MLRTLSITALPAAVAGVALFLLLTWLAGGSARLRSRSHATPPPPSPRPPMPVYTPDPNFTPNPFPDLVTPEAELYDLPDVCGGQTYTSELLGAVMCLADGWEIAHEESARDELVPEDQRPTITP